MATTRDTRAANSSPRKILGMRVDPISAYAARDVILGWAAAPCASAHIVCAANVHMVMEAYDDPSFQALVNGADLVLPDGVPTVWGLRLLGARIARRVRVSPDFIFDVLGAAERHHIPVGLYGGTEQTLPAIRAALLSRFPSLSIAFDYAPPFRPLMTEEDEEVVVAIRESGARVLLVGIGCPKQERWMAAHRHSVPCVMMGVGAAFDLFAGNTKEAPGWTRDIGLEWLYRLLLEPRRLWRRHLRNNPRFASLFAQQLIRSRLL